jgi:hypothetical protein
MMKPKKEDREEGVYCPRNQRVVLTEDRFEAFLLNHWSHLVARVASLETSNKLILAGISIIITALSAVIGLLLTR